MLYQCEMDEGVGGGNQLQRPTRRLRMLYPENDPEGLKVFDCPECLTENAVIEDDTGYHCRACGKRFGEDFFDDWRDGIEPEDI